MFWAVTHLTRYDLVWVSTAKWSPIRQYIVIYPDLLDVGGGIHDMCACVNSQSGLYWSTLPCPWLNNSTEIVHSLSFKERQMPDIQSDYANSVNYSLWNFMIFYCLHKIQRHLCVERLSILSHLKRGRCLKFSLSRQILLTLPFETFWSFIVCIKFSAIYV